MPELEERWYHRQLKRDGDWSQNNRAPIQIALFLADFLIQRGYALFEIDKNIMH